MHGPISQNGDFLPFSSILPNPKHRFLIVSSLKAASDLQHVSTGHLTKLRRRERFSDPANLWFIHQPNRFY